jgi:hypothetical protein
MRACRIARLEAVVPAAPRDRLPPDPAVLISWRHRRQPLPSPSSHSLTMSAPPPYGAPPNPDTRPLPPGWVQQYDNKCARARARGGDRA